MGRTRSVLFKSAQDVTFGIGAIVVRVNSWGCGASGSPSYANSCPGAFDPAHGPARQHCIRLCCAAGGEPLVYSDLEYLLSFASYIRTTRGRSSPGRSADAPSLPGLPEGSPCEAVGTWSGRFAGS